ncbi:hypothetical protein [Methylobacterium nigriterrae]|uniref:hypothetical protein n=1 Tax=Methylobacterium nigriterrae TaxID=3127512 RepID=UPI003013211A
MFPSRLVLRALAVIGTAASAACSGDVNPLRAAAIESGYGAKPIAAPDFVTESRKGGGDFLPVGISAPARPVRAKSAEGQKALEAELEGARNRNEAQGRAAEGAAKGGVKSLAAPKPAPAE